MLGARGIRQALEDQPGVQCVSGLSPAATAKRFGRLDGCDLPNISGTKADNDAYEAENHSGERQAPTSLTKSLDPGQGDNTQHNGDNGTKAEQPDQAEDEDGYGKPAAWSFGYGRWVRFRPRLCIGHGLARHLVCLPFQPGRCSASPPDLRTGPSRWTPDRATPFVPSLPPANVGVLPLVATQMVVTACRRRPPAPPGRQRGVR